MGVDPGELVDEALGGARGCPGADSTAWMMRRQGVGNGAPPAVTRYSSDPASLIVPANTLSSGLIDRQTRR